MCRLQNGRPSQSRSLTLEERPFFSVQGSLTNVSDTAQLTLPMLESSSVFIISCTVPYCKNVQSMSMRTGACSTGIVFLPCCRPFDSKVESCNINKLQMSVRNEATSYVANLMRWAACSADSRRVTDKQQQSSSGSKQWNELGIRGLSITLQMPMALCEKPALLTSFSLVGCIADYDSMACIHLLPSSAES